MPRHGLGALGLCGLLLTACGGPAGGGAGPAPSTALLDQCAVCEKENPDSYYACVQVCTAAGLWGPGSDDVRGRR